MEKAVFQKKLRWLGAGDVAGFSVPKPIREEMGVEKGDMLKIKIEKVKEDEK